MSSPSTLSVRGKSSVFVSVNSGAQSITLTDGVEGQRVVIVNTSATNTLTILNGANSIIINTNEGKELIYYQEKWYSLS